MAIENEDLILYSKWKSPGQAASGTATVSVTAVTMPNNTASLFETSVPFDASVFATAQVYYQSPAYPGYWHMTPDTYNTGAPDGMPVSISGAIVGNTLRLRVIYRNTFGGPVTIAARTLTLKYFLFV